jgi:pyruvate ferredoxin oxidoreductase alpha subunit
VDAWLPPFDPQHRLDINAPRSMGTIGMPEIYTEAKKAQGGPDQLLSGDQGALGELCQGLWPQLQAPIDAYKTEDADTVFVIMGSMGETIETAVDEMRADGKKVGSVNIRLWRPFPTQDFMAALGSAKNMVVIDRATAMPGSDSGPVATEVKSLLFDKVDRPMCRTSSAAWPDVT